ncbi:YHS domain-containing (seleno)protein [Rhodoplanes sp.]|uniref:YHS domain-containing (seleno)protein n=1 Tax=Rhodoplanes sp. TaxID=1968906 RepID=UPI0025E9E783|nr:YHS domain-containing (seleno)protein [Rhodoplanes sp.]
MALGLVAFPAIGLHAATTERVVTDRYSGLAISGFDPVSYFVDQKPVEGRPEYEYTYGGTVWRFRNEGNRNAFADNPSVYAPLFGGYDPVGIARGVSRPGHPEVFLVLRGRLLLFYGEAAREQFLADPVTVLTDAQSHWPQVRAGLTP